MNLDSVHRGPFCSISSMKLSDKDTSKKTTESILTNIHNSSFPIPIDANEVNDSGKVFGMELLLSSCDSECLTFTNTGSIAAKKSLNFLYSAFVDKVEESNVFQGEARKRRTKYTGLGRNSPS